MFAVISIQQLERLLDQKQPLLLVDLRPAQDYQKVHLENAINIPYDQLEENVFPADRRIPLVFYCEHGGKSMQAARDFAQRGWNTLSLGCGIRYYRGKHLQNFIDRSGGNA